MRISTSQKGGSVLVITLILCVLVGLMLAAYLNLVGSQNKFTQRSQVWNNVIPLCEAGVEEALTHINYSGTTSNFAINGWVLSNTNYIKTRTNSDGRYQMSISTDIQPVITVQGFLLVPVQTNYLSRTVQVKTTLNRRFPQAVLAKGAISMGGNAIAVNSFNSTNSAYNTGGQYDPLKARDQATVATDSKTAGSVSIGNANVFGKAATGPGGTVVLNNGTVGDTAWDSNNANRGAIEPGHSANDMNIYIPDVKLPPSLLGAAPPGPQISILGVVTANYLLTSGDYALDSINLSSSSKILVTGKARLYVRGSTSMSGQAQIEILPGGSLEFYSAGTASFGGGGVLNDPGNAANFAFYGLPSCTSVSYGGNAGFIGTIYAPEASVTMQGTSDMVGAFVGNTVTLGGNGSMHYDEALQGDPTEGRYLVASWLEL